MTVNVGYASLIVAMLLLVHSPAVNAQESASANQDKSITLFDGSNLDHWRGYHQEDIGAGWKIDDGILKFDGSRSGDIVTKKEFGDYELTLEWLVTEGANSGVMYKVSLGDSAPYLSGPEYQILDDTKHHDGKNPLTSAASLYGLYTRGETKTNPVGEWNTAKIRIQGNTVQHWLNGTMAVETEIGSDDWNEKVADSKFRDWEKFGVNQTGHICLQDHGDEVWFRNIRIKLLSGDE